LRGAVCCPREQRYSSPPRQRILRIIDSASDGGIFVYDRHKQTDLTVNENGKVNPHYRIGGDGEGPEIGVYITIEAPSAGGINIEVQEAAP
jgi:hypothetical protein